MDIKVICSLEADIPADLIAREKAKTGYTCNRCKRPIVLRFSGQAALALYPEQIELVCTACVPHKPRH